MSYDKDIIKCPCGKSFVPVGCEHQCPYCKGKKRPPIQDLLRQAQCTWEKLCQSEPSFPSSLHVKTNSPSSLNWELTPKTKKVQTMTIKLPPKPRNSNHTLNDVFNEVFPEERKKSPPKVVKDTPLPKDLIDEFDAFFRDPIVIYPRVKCPCCHCKLNSVAIYHPRNEFYGGNRSIYWYEFSPDAIIPFQFLRVAGTAYYEFGGSHTEAIDVLKKSGFVSIVEGVEI